MATALSDMKIEEISLVDDGANPGAKVEIFKAKMKPCGDCKTPDACMKKGACMKKSDDYDDDDMDDDDGDMAQRGRRAMAKSAAPAAALRQEFEMDLEELSKSLEAAEAKLDELEKANAGLTDVVKAKDARIAELEGTIAKAADPAAADDAFLKSLPEVAREAIVKARKAEADAKAELQKARDKQDAEAAIAKAKALGFGNADEVGPLLVRVAKGMTTADDAQALEKLLKSAGEIAGASPLFKAMGAAAAVEGDPAELLKAKADEIQKANTGMTYEAAYAKAVDQNPALYGAYVNKRRAG
jgi:hypothetical protein